MSGLNKIDSNSTGLRYAEETSLKVLPAAASQFWKPLEPNSYNDFGGQITTVARNPINAGRQRKKGVVTDLEASGGFNTDVTQTNLQDILQGFFFADLRKKTETTNTTAVVGADDQYTTADGASYRVNDLVLATGFSATVNNGLKVVEAVDPAFVQVSDTALVDETVSGYFPTVVRVGHQFASADARINASGHLTTESGGKDLTQLGIIPGEWVFIGGDAANTFFAGAAANNGFARVRSVTAHLMTFDKTAGTHATDTGTGKTIQIFFGRVLKNEIGSLIKRRSYALERSLGASDDADLTKQQAEYLLGSVPNEMTFNVPTAEKATIDLSFVALDNTTLNENTSGVNTLLSKAAVAAGSALNAPSIVEADAFNTSSDVSRIKLSVHTPGQLNPTPLFAFAQELTITINNNVTPNKAIGVLGAFEATAGTFEVGGSITAYFADVAAVQAVRNNSDITLDLHLVKANAGITFDLPLITLGNGRLNVEQDAPITLPLDNSAATGAKIDTTLDYTLLMVFWPYLPNLAG